MKKISILSILLLSICIFLPSNCFAQNNNEGKGFSVTPFFQNIVLDENTSQDTFYVEVGNNTNSSLVFNFSVIDFGSLGESGGIAFLGTEHDLKNKYGLASWLSLEQDAMVLEAGEKKQIKVMVTNKESLSPGGHYAAIIAKLDNNQDYFNRESSQIAFDPSFASLIFVRKTGGEIFNLEINKIDFEGSMLDSKAMIRLRLQNSGNVQVVPRGLIRVFDPIGREVFQGFINNESALILPETFRLFQSQISKIALAFIPGKYKIVIQYRYDGKDDFIEKSEYVDFIPRIAILSGLIIFMVIGGFAWYGIRRYIRKKKATKNS
jgi:hypothetical protein